jgi:hypothetical protein
MAAPAAAAAALLLLLAPGPAAGDQAAAAAGEALYAAGARPGAAAPQARTAGGAVLPATALPCAGCHGAEGGGGGRAEAGVRPPPIAWGTLSRATAGRPAYTPETLLRAVATGQAAGGRALDPAMPRYALTLEDGAALLGWLRALDARAAPGVEEGRLRLGLLLPAGPGGAAFAEAFGAGLAAAAPEGVFGRRLEAVPAIVATPGAATAVTRQLLSEGVLLLVSALPEAGPAEAAIAAAVAERAPVLALRAAGPAAPSPFAYALLPGAAEEGLALLRAVPEPDRALLAADAAARPLAGRIAARLAAESGAEPRLVPLDGLDREAAAAASAVLLLGAPEALAAAAASAALRAAAVPVLLPGALGGASAAATVAAALGRPVHVGLWAPPEGGGGGGAAAQRFAASGAARLGPVGRLGHAAAEVVVETLRRSGRAVTRERALAAWGSGEPFEAGALPALRLSGGGRGAGGGSGVVLVQVDGAGRAWRGGLGAVRTE